MAKVMNDHILKKITGVSYTVLPNGRSTVCQITLESGFTVEGISACVDGGEFDHKAGEEKAFQLAFQKAFKYEAYLLAHERFLASQVDGKVAA